MPMQKIGKMKLKNAGGFVAKIQFTYLDDNGEKKTTTKKSDDITLGFDKTVNPGDYEVPDGSMIYLFVFVVMGKDNEAKRSFIYEKGNTTCANYVITGTTGDNDLGLIDVS